MAEATNAQMQAYCDQRIRPRSEQFRSFLNSLVDDLGAIGDEYARASGSNAWADARTDGPPHLLKAGNSASPDDVLNYNAWGVALKNLVNGTSVSSGSTVAADAATLVSAWLVLQRACVRPA